MTDFQFRDYPVFTDGEIDVVLAECRPPKLPHDALPVYSFNVVVHATGSLAGGVRLRVGYTDDTVRYYGHIGYTIDEAYRGRRYAVRACRLIQPVIIDHGLDVVWITCNPDNWASRKTCEHLGCELIEIVQVPPANPMYLRGDREKCRYRWIVYGGAR